MRLRADPPLDVDLETFDIRNMLPHAFFVVQVHNSNFQLPDPEMLDPKVDESKLTQILATFKKLAIGCYCAADYGFPPEGLN